MFIGTPVTEKASFSSEKNRKGIVGGIVLALEKNHESIMSVEEGEEYLTDEKGGGGVGNFAGFFFFVGEGVNLTNVLFFFPLSRGF